MPKNVPSEFVGRFSIRPKKPPKRRSSSATTPTESADVAYEESGHRRKLSKLSGSSSSTHSELSDSGSTPAEGSYVSSPLISTTSSEKGKATVSPGLESYAAYSTPARSPEEFADSYSRSARSAAPKTSPYGPSTPKTLSESRAAHDYEDEIYQIFASSWGQRLEPGQRQFSTTAKALAYGVVNVRDTGPEMYILGIIQAIRHYASDNPQSLDFLLVAFIETTRLFPESITTEYGRGPHAGMQGLRSWLVDRANVFQGATDSDTLSCLDTTDRSNVLVHPTDVATDLARALEQVQDWKRQRTACLITAAMYTRSYSLGIMRTEDKRQIESLIDTGLLQTQGRWSIVDFICACLLLRGCARSLLRGEKEKLLALRNTLKRFLVQEGGFVIKAHATLALRNVIDGPFDERSEQLFASADWIF